MQNSALEEHNYRLAEMGKKKIRNSTQFFFQSRAKDGDEDYQTFWNRIERNPEETIFNSIGEAYQDIEDNQIVAHLNEKYLRYYTKNHLVKRPPKTIPAVPKTLIENVIVTKNSPLGPILSHGCKLLAEKGIIDILDSNQPYVKKSEKVFYLLNYSKLR